MQDCNMSQLRFRSKIMREKKQEEKDSRLNKYILVESSSSNSPKSTFAHLLLPVENIITGALTVFHNVLIHHRDCIFQDLQPLLQPVEAFHYTSICMFKNMKILLYPNSLFLLIS